MNDKNSNLFRRKTIYNKHIWEGKNTKFAAKLVRKSWNSLAKQAKQHFEHQHTKIIKNKKRKTNKQNTKVKNNTKTTYKL